MQFVGAFLLNERFQSIEKAGKRDRPRFVVSGIFNSHRRYVRNYNDTSYLNRKA